MLLTAPLLAKSSSFLGSLINKCRQVIKTQPTITAESTTNLEKTHNKKLINNVFTKQSTANQNANQYASSPATVSDISLNRPAAINAIEFSSSSVVAGARVFTFEEQVGLPPRPKKPLTPYFRYLKQTRSKVVSENPNLTTSELVRLISKQWETADPSLKKRLQDEYQLEKQKYVEVRAKYEANVTQEQRDGLKQLKQERLEDRERRNMRRRLKELGRPKRPASAFLRFMVQERAKSPSREGEIYREWHQKTVEKWGKLSDAEKEVFMKEARKELEKYQKDIKLWEEKMVRQGHIDVVRHSSQLLPPEPKSKKL